MKIRPVILAVVLGAGISGAAATYDYPFPDPDLTLRKTVTVLP